MKKSKQTKNPPDTELGRSIKKMAEILIELTGKTTLTIGEHVALDKAIVLLAWMTDEEFERISERATKGWLE